MRYAFLPGMFLSMLALAVGCSDAAVAPLVPPVVTNGDSGGADTGTNGSDASSDVAIAPDGGADAGGIAANEARIVVHYPGAAMAVRGEAAGLNWDADSSTRSVAAGVFEIRVQFAPNDGASVAFKPRLGGVWSLGPNYRAARGGETHVYPHFTVTSGTVTKLRTAFMSAKLPAKRNLWVYTPPSAVENTLARYPVIYMHDAQNLFEPTAAFGGVAWEVDAAFDKAAGDGSFREAYVVGIDNTADRMTELTPTRDSVEGFGGGGDAYLDMLTSEIKPIADAELRTLPGRENTGIVGSSLGGLISFHAGLTRGSTYGLVGALSPSTFWDNELIVRRAPTLQSNPNRPLKLYVDSGDSGVVQDDLPQTTRLAAACRAAGYRDNVDLKHVVGAGDSHNETAWQKRLPSALAFLLGPGR
jgi:predicted alpha/beta superfamily hydrolase